jgi:hypothetical protein
VKENFKVQKPKFDEKIFIVIFQVRFWDAMNFEGLVKNIYIKNPK